MKFLRRVTLGLLMIAAGLLVFMFVYPHVAQPAMVEAMSSRQFAPTPRYCANNEADLSFLESGMIICYRADPSSITALGVVRFDLSGSPLQEQSMDEEAWKVARTYLPNIR